MKHKKFNVGDKIFAKVKGYHAWPAIVTHATKYKYKVCFYGTREVANCKPQDIFYYLQHREKFIKNQKRKEYLDAVEEIDIAIAECGGVDGSSENVNNSIGSNSEASFNSGIEEGSNKKRRSDSNIAQSRKSSTTEKKQKKSIEQGPDSASVSISDVQSKSVSGCSSPMVQSQQEASHTASLCSSIVSEPRLTIGDIKVITPQYLQRVCMYADHVRSRKEVYKNLPEESRYNKRNEIVIVKLSSGKIVGIKYNRDEEGVYHSEYDRAVYDGDEATTMLSMKSMLENGQCSPEEDPTLFETNLDMTEEQIQESTELAEIENKKHKLDWLKVETRLAELDAEIKKQLGLEKANPEKAEVHLGEMLKLKIEALMLLKHSNIFEMVRRLRKYVGNVFRWNFTELERHAFEAHATKVREKAEAIYKKFMSVLKYTGTDDPWKYYMEQVERFKEQVKNMEECHVFALTAPPTSRAAFFDKLEDEEELKEMAIKFRITKVNTHLCKM